MNPLIRKVGYIFAAILALLAVYFIYDTLRTRSLDEKLAEIVHLEDRRDLSRVLRNYLKDDDPKVRERAALAVGRIGGKEGAELIFDLVSTDASIDVASTAAFALGLSGEKQFSSKLLDIAYDLPGRVAASAVLSAGRLADSTMKGEQLVLESYFTHPSPEVRESACYAAYLCTARLASAKMFDLFNVEPDENVKIAALYSLARMGIAQAETIYEDFLSDADPFVRSVAVRGLSYATSDESTHLLAIATNDSDPGVAASAVLALGKRKSGEAEKLLLKKLGLADDPKIIVSIFDALKTQNNDGGVDIAYDIIATSQSNYIISAALLYLAHFQKDRSVNLIDSLMATEDQYLKSACAEAYGKVERNTVVPRLTKLFIDKNPSVRMAAFNSLFEVDKENQDYYLGQALNDADEVVVGNAVSKVSELKLAKYLPKLVEISSDSKQIGIDVRRSLVDAASSFLGVNPKDSLAKELLINGAIDPEYIVRKDAAAIYKNILGEDRNDIIRHPFTRISEGKIEDGLELFNSNPSATIFTSRGQIEMELYFDTAPLTVLNFMQLAKDGFYDGLKFHRVVPNFVAQGGDPRGDGWGGPNY
ncbi:MAG TPA: HEAT repeat domain-containing protein, partial [candidate division Zixibacteria bacterium]|nr:HEAT repeat domain-containing protein [candidate division Zixibacteria bacterium]